MRSCQRTAFAHHKQYCKRMIYYPTRQLRDTLEAKKKVDQMHPLLVAAREALEEEPADRRAQFTKVGLGRHAVFWAANACQAADAPALTHAAHTHTHTHTHAHAHAHKHTHTHTHMRTHTHTHTHK